MYLSIDTAELAARGWTGEEDRIEHPDHDYALRIETRQVYGIWHDVWIVFNKNTLAEVWQTIYPRQAVQHAESHS